MSVDLEKQSEEIETEKKVKQHKDKKEKQLEKENKQFKKELKHLRKVKKRLRKQIKQCKKIMVSTGVSDRQQRIFHNKEKHGFNTTNIYQEARYILEEVAELMRAVEKNDRANMKEELADIVIFAYGCAEVARLGRLDDEIEKKMKINESRKYHKNKEGDFVKNTK